MPTTIELPEAALVVLVGPAGAGKTTFAARHFDPAEILSSDALRARVAGDPADQGATSPAFAILHRSLTRRLAAGHLTVVDATNVERHARAALLRRAAVAHVAAIAIVLDVPLATALARNRRRPGRVVDESVVVRQWRRLAVALRRGDLRDEGFDAVVVLDEPSLDAVAVVRTGTGTPAVPVPRLATSG